MRSVSYLHGIGRPIESIAYVGDLDAAGLAIAIEAAAAGADPGWPDAGAAPLDADTRTRLVAFLAPSVRVALPTLLGNVRRIPEDVLGPDELDEVWGGT